MSIIHAKEGQAIEVVPYGPDASERRTVALFKSEQLEVIRLVLAAGKSMPQHKVAGDITVQCLQGRIDIAWNGTSTALGPNQFMFLLGQMPHSIHAIEDAMALLTIVLRK